MSQNKCRFTDEKISSTDFPFKTNVKILIEKIYKKAKYIKCIHMYICKYICGYYKVEEMVLFQENVFDNSKCNKNEDNKSNKHTRQAKTDIYALQYACVFATFTLLE